MNTKVVLAIVGHGTSGKTTIARYFAAICDLHYRYSTSEFAKMHVKLPGDHKDRSQNRVAWGQAIADFNNEDDGIKLYKMMADTHNVFDGIRRVDELQKFGAWVQANGLIFVPIWVDRDVPDDPSCEICPEHCRFSINNRNELLDLWGNIDFFWHGIKSF